MTADPGFRWRREFDQLKGVSPLALLAYCDPHTKLVGRSGSPFGARNVGQNKTGAAFFAPSLNNLLLAEIVFGFNFEPTADESNSLTHALA